MCASMIYEGARTGTVRGRAIDYEYTERPFGFVFQMTFNVSMAFIGLFMVGMGVVELFR